MSGHRYTLHTLLEMAVTVEKSAKDFYNTLGQRFLEHYYVFRHLADEEEDHEKRYVQLLGKRKVEEIYSTEEERKQADYNIKVLEDTGIVDNLRKGAARAMEIPDLKSALKAAVQLEKDTMLFYYNMAMAIGSKEDRQEIYKIIRIEHDHLSRVQSLTL